MAGITYDEAAHLIRRMGFGGSPQEIDGLVARGREGAVDFLINYAQVDNRSMDDLIARSFDFSNPLDFTKLNRSELERWWFTRMVHTRRPFEEKMTLFWHNHFATAASKVPDIFMYVQNRKLRDHSLDRFDTLLKVVSEDAAMLIWLDGIQNVKGSPNENFARELQELFTMGITDVVTGEANYTEDDVKEIARAFTGGKIRFARGSADPFAFEFFVNPAEHDNHGKDRLRRDGELLRRRHHHHCLGSPLHGPLPCQKAFRFLRLSHYFQLLRTSQTVEKFANVYCEQQPLDQRSCARDIRLG